MGHQLFEIPVIQQDLRHEETIVQISDALEYLNQVCNEVFSCIESRIESNKTKLDKLCRRAIVTKAKVNKLTGSNKATKVFSSAKYPATEVHSDYESSFISHCPSQMGHSTEKIKSNFLPPEGKDLQEKLQFYHVKVSNKLLRRNIEIAPEEGLGSLPRDVDSISSLLLFNTSENPYKRYVMLDPLGAVTKTRQALDDEEDKRLEAAPISISHQEKMERQEGETFFYSPGLGEVPQMDVPLDLPYLPGIADDLCYNMDSGPMIAPSVATTPAMPELPNLEPESPSLPPPAPPPAPPPPPPALSQSMPAMPPPPPPPPVFAPTPPPALTAAPVLTPAPKGQVIESGDARSSLMEAIRKAGGSGKALLKSAEEKKMEAKKKKQEEKASGEGSGDLMADLHAKLAMRRKGISGIIKTTESSAMDRLKDMIPPPTTIEHSTSSNTEEDGDWE